MVVAKLLSIWLMFAPPAVTELKSVRNLYLQAPADEAKANDLLRLLDQLPATSPTVQGYKGAVTMVMARHSLNPYAKLRYFNTGKTVLESAIAADPNNIELRYLRYTIQSNLPAFLGYNQRLTDDRFLLSTQLPQISDTQLKGMVQSYLKRKHHETN